MGRIVVTEFVSLDGVVEDPGGSESFKHGGWSFKVSRGDEGDKFNSMPKHVVSSTLDRPELNNSSVLEGDLDGEVAKLKERYDGDVVVHGSAQLVQALLERDLVDELRLMVFPVVLGSGKRLFAETSDAKPLRLVDSRTVGDGVTILVFEPGVQKKESGSG